MTREYVYFANDGEMVITSAKDRSAAQAQIEKELGREVAQSKIELL